MTETVSKRRWVVCLDGHVWPDQAGEQIHAMGDYPWPRQPGHQVRGPGSQVLCLVCNTATLVSTALWRWPDELDDLRWSGITEEDSSAKLAVQPRLQEEADAALRCRGTRCVES